MNAGDTIGLCDGGSFTESAAVSLENTKCRAGNPCTVRDYVPPWGAQGTSGDGLPVVNVGSNVIAMWFVGQGSPAVHDEGYAIRNLVLLGGGIAAAGLTFAQGVTDVDVCNVTLDNFALGGIGVANSTVPSASGVRSDSEQARINIHGCTITNNPGGFMGAGNDVHVNYNRWDHNSVSDLSHTAYWAQATDSVGGVDTIYTATGEQFIGNVITNSNPVGGPCNNTEVVVHGAHDGLDIENNTLIEASGNVTGGCYAIQVDPGDPLAEHFENTIIRGNTIAEYGGIGIALSGCPSGCVIENNLLVDSDTSFSGRTAISSGGDGLGTGDLGSNAVKIRNNTIYFASGSNNAIGIYVGGQGMGYEISNNVMEATNTGSVCFLNLPLNLSAFSFIDHNDAFAPAAPFNWECQRGMSLSAWQASGNFDANSMNLDPVFVKPGVTDYDFHPGVGSPLVGAGSVGHGAVSDITGKARAKAPDVGAYQQ